MTQRYTRPILNISKSTLDATYHALSLNRMLWEGDLDTCLQRISETLCKTLHVDRAATWLLNPATDCFVLLNRYDQKTRRHSNDAEIPIGGYPNYFSALEENLIISAVDAHSDYRTREFSENYLVPNGIGSLLNVPLRITGRLGGILCVEHVGGQRLWNEHEKRFVLSVAELISQRLLYEDIQINDTRYRELGTLQQAIFNGAYCSIISTKLDGTIQSFNRAASRMLGYSAEELTGQQALTLFHDMREMEQRAHELSNKLGRAIEPGFEVLVTMARRDMTEEREWTYVRKDGERIPVVASITALVDQNETVTGFLVISRDITDRILTQRALREEEARYRLLFESTNDAIFLMKNDRFVDCNPAALTMFGCTKEQIVNRTPLRYSPELQPDGQTSEDKAQEKTSAAFRGETQYFEWRHQRRDSTIFDAEVALSAVEINGEFQLLATVRDISARKIAERELEASRKQLLHRNENLSLTNELSNRLHGSLSVDTIVAETLLALLGMTHPPHIAIYLIDDKKPLLKLVSSHGFDKDSVKAGRYIPLENSLSGLALKTGRIMVSNDFYKDSRLNEKMKQLLLQNRINSVVIIPLLYRDRSMGSINLLYNDNRTFSDIELETFDAIGKSVSLSLANTQHMRKLEIMAHHDSLTGLPNRTLLHKRFNEVMDENPDTSAALLLLDLDRFKEINDTLGHHIGDKLLQQIGPRLSNTLDAHDALLSRLGGDEFTILVFGVTDKAKLRELSQSLLNSLRLPFSINSLALEIDVSIGVAIYPKDGKNSHALLRSADVAMYDAKRKGGGISLYDRSVDKHTPERLALIAELGRGLRENQFRLHYQPKMDLQSGKVTGFEALVRWEHPQMGTLYPDKFIHLAEVSDAIHLLTQVVLDRALTRQKQWSENGYDFSVAVNLSVRNLIDERCVNAIESMLQRYGTQPGKLELEITETALMHDPDGAVSLLNRLSALGVKLSIDDFGTGYSSLSYLRRLPINALKIDREFVLDMLSTEQNTIIVRSTIALAHNLGLKVIAEGVENKATLDALEKMGCDQAQGYLISKPDEWQRVEAHLLS